MVGRFVRISFVFAIVSLLTRCSSGPLDPESEASLAPRALELSVDCDTAEDLSARIAELEADGALNPGRATALRSKLAQAERWEMEGRPDKAAAALQRLIDQLEDWVADGTLSEEDVENLLLCAEDVADGPDVEFEIVSAGRFHACGLITGGEAYCWGANFSGQLGNGTHTESNTPVPVAGGINFMAISAGDGAHTCGLTAAGAAYCWGFNHAGQLGNGTNTESNVPVAVVVGLAFDGISTGFGHTCGLTPDGDAYCWGDNDNGILGNGDASQTDSNAPVAVAGGWTFESIDAGHEHTCGVATGGDAYCWGVNNEGELGIGPGLDQSTPTAVAGGLSFESITTGAEFTCGVTVTGDAYCWGEDNGGQLGNGPGPVGGSRTPLQVAGGLDFHSISAGLSHACGVISDGDGYCWGWNTSGQLGDGTTGVNRDVPVPVEGRLSFASISAGGEYTCGLSTAGQAYCWGDNDGGQLGDGTNADSNVPVPVTSP